MAVGVFTIGVSVGVFVFVGVIVIVAVGVSVMDAGVVRMAVGDSVGRAAR